MSGFITFSLGGVAFLLLGVHESLSPLLPFPTATHSFRFISTLLLSLLSTFSSLLASLSAHRRRDPILHHHLSSLPVSLLFLLYSLAGLLLPLLPSPALDLVLLAAFSLQSLFLSQTLTLSPSTLDSRYFDLLLVPILICAASTFLAIFRPRSPFPPLARGIGLVLYGSWLVQMGFSFFSTAIARGCAVVSKGWGSYSVTCRGHEDYHRSKAIATLQFNCHLAALVVAVLGVYAAVSGRKGAEVEYEKYRPLREMGASGGGESLRFTLDSDEDEEEGRKKAESAGEITVEAQTGGMNGNGNAH